MITINDYTLSGRLEPWQGIGAFTIIPKQQPFCTIMIPAFELRKLKQVPDAPGGLAVTQETIISLNIVHRLELLRLSIKTISKYFMDYTAKDFESFLRSVIGEDKHDLIERGSILLVNELEATFPSICGLLIESLTDTNVFYDHFITLLERLSPDYGASYKDRTCKDDFINNCIKQCTHTDGRESDDHEPYLTSTLRAFWLPPILMAIWEGDLKYRAYKTPKLQRNVNDLFLDIAHVDLCPNPDSDKVKQDKIWVEFSGELTAGLSPTLVDKVLRQHDQGIVIDLIKLFTTLWNENPDIQRRNSVNIPNRFNGLLDMLHERYGLSKCNANMTKVIRSCQLIEAIRWGTDWTDHEKLMAFGGRKRNQQLVVTYLEGFRNPLVKSERLVPILNHPKGKGRSHPSFNRFGLALGSWLVEHSHIYYNSGGTGVPLDESAYCYFKQKVGFKRKADVDRAIASFQDSGAITLTGGVLGLGEINEEGKRLILEGAHGSIRGARGGRKSKRTRQR